MDSGNYQTRYAVMEALGQMGPILSDDRIFKNTTQVNVFSTISEIRYLKRPQLICHFLILP